MFCYFCVYRKVIHTHTHTHTHTHVHVKIPVCLGLPFQPVGFSLPVIPLDNSYSILEVSAQNALQQDWGFLVDACSVLCNSYGPQSGLNLVP